MECSSCEWMGRKYYMCLVCLTFGNQSVLVSKSFVQPDLAVVTELCNNITWWCGTPTVMCSTLLQLKCTRITSPSSQSHRFIADLDNRPKAHALVPSTSTYSQPEAFKACDQYAVDTTYFASSLGAFKSCISSLMYWCETNACA